MPRDFRSFSSESNKKFYEGEKFLNDNKTEADKYQDILNKYKNMDNGELMQNLFTEASKLKKEGKLDNSTLNNLKSTLAPFLNNEQQEMLNNLVNAINEQK